MSEWQPIETAPVGVRVRLGWWEDHAEWTAMGDPMKWKSRDGVAWVQVGRWLFKRVVRGDYADRATHWMPLPAPPARGGAA